MLVFAVPFVGKYAYSAESARSRGVVRVGEYFHNLEAAGAHEGGAKRDLGANARTRDSPNQDDFASAYHVGQRDSGGGGWWQGRNLLLSFRRNRISCRGPSGR